MAIPTSTIWDLADFDESTIGTLLGLAPADMVASPSVSPYFAYETAANVTVRAESTGTDASLSLVVPVPVNFTAEILVKFSALPNSTADLDASRAGLIVANDAGRGVAIYFAKTGLAVSRIDDFGSVTPLPDTTGVTQEITEGYTTVRVAVDGGLGRAYIYFGSGLDTNPALEFIVPVDATPSGTADTFQLFVKGSSVRPVSLLVQGLRLASGLVGYNSPPRADPGPDRVTALGSSFRLDGRASFDPEGAPITFRWTVADVPFGSQYAVDLSGCSTVPDSGDGYTSVFTFPPATLPDWVGAGDIVQVGGRSHEIVSTDNVFGFITVAGDTVPDDLSSVPFRILRQSLLVDSTTETPYAVPDVQGVYRFALVVSDGTIDSEPAEVIANVVGARAPLGTEPDVSDLWNMLGDEWRYVKDRGIFEEAWRGVAQILGAKLLEAWQYHYNFSLKDAQSVFQKRWIPYHSLVSDTEPAAAEYRVHDGLISSEPFVYDAVAIAAGELTFEVYVGGVVTTFVLPGSEIVTNPLPTLALYGLTGSTAAYAGDIVLWFEPLSDGTSFRIASSTIPSIPFEVGVWSTLAGTQGARATDRTYVVDPWIDLSTHGVTEGDYLVLNNGQSFLIDRVLTGVGDPTSYSRVLVTETLPLDASTTWKIPSRVSGAEDYERRGVYPGDLAKIEAYHDQTGDTAYLRGVVVGQSDNDVLVDFDPGDGAVIVGGAHTLHFVGVKKRKALEVAPGTRSIPRLQDKIPVSASPTLWLENADYVLEPFYRETDGSGLPMLQFRDSVFIDTDTEPPDILWAELTVLSNDENIEGTFGRLVGLSLLQAATLGPDFNYLAGVSGLLYAQQRGPNVESMRGGAQILLGQPFAEVDGNILEILPDFTPTKGRILIRDADGNTPSRSEILRSYLYSKDPLDLSSTSGLDRNPSTGAPWAAGDDILQFSPIGSGVLVLDLYNDPEWYYPLVRSGLMSEIEKFHTFSLTFNLDLVTTANMEVLVQFLERTKPSYTSHLLMGRRSHVEDVDVLDSAGIAATFSIYDVMCGASAWFYDEMRGDGTYWHHYDDVGLQYDALTDCPTDYIDVVFDFHWTGGIINSAVTPPVLPYGGALLFDPGGVIDVDGAMGPAGGTVVLVDNVTNILAGTYRFTSAIKGSGVLP